MTMMTSCLLTGLCVERLASDLHLKCAGPCRPPSFGGDLFYHCYLFIARSEFPVPSSYEAVNVAVGSSVELTFSLGLVNLHCFPI